MYYVYVLQSQRGKNLYIGYTGDLKRRMKEHKKDLPDFVLIYYEAYNNEESARCREYKLKHYGSAWRSLKKRTTA